MPTPPAQQEVSKMQNDNDVVCFECGIKYLSEQQKKGEGSAVTFHWGKCCECGVEKSVTSIRHYNNLKHYSQP